MSGKMIGRILVAALLTAPLATPLPARAETVHPRAVAQPSWKWLIDLWSNAFGLLLPSRPEPAGTKQGLLIDPNGGGVPTDGCTDSCVPGTATDPNR
jgi:hypothetical protein